MTTPYKLISCIIRENKEIHGFLEQRFNELNLTNVSIVEDANKNGREMNIYQLCRYRKRGLTTGTLIQGDVIWLCHRYSISLNLVVAKLEEYNEKECLKKIKKIYK